MCVIAYGNVAKIIPNVKKMMEHNSDGAGFAFTPDGKTVCYEKGLLNVDMAIERLSGLRQTADILFHARIATHGGKSLLLTHPFPVDGSAELHLQGTVNSVIAHNGIWTDYKIFLPETPNNSGPWSDTRVMSYIMEQGIVTDKFLEYAGGSWIAFYANKPPVLAGKWAEEDGVSYSNLLWKFSSRVYEITSYATKTYPVYADVYGERAQQILPYYSKHSEPDYRQRWERINDIPGLDYEDYYDVYTGEVKTRKVIPPEVGSN